MTAEPVSTRPPFARSPHELVLVARPRRATTVVKILGLVAITTLGTALAVAIVAGTALFTILNLA